MTTPTTTASAALTPTAVYNHSCCEAGSRKYTEMTRRPPTKYASHRYGIRCTRWNAWEFTPIMFHRVRTITLNPLVRLGQPHGQRRVADRRSAPRVTGIRFMDAVEWRLRSE